MTLHQCINNNITIIYYYDNYTVSYDECLDLHSIMDVYHIEAARAKWKKSL
jgi:hypothetical protein